MVGLLFFVAVFAVIAFWALRPANKKTIEWKRNSKMSMLGMKYINIKKKNTETLCDFILKNSS